MCRLLMRRLPVLLCLLATAAHPGPPPKECQEIIPLSVRPFIDVTEFRLSDDSVLKIAGPNDATHPRLWEGPVTYGKCRFTTFAIDFFAVNVRRQEITAFTFDGDDRFTETLHGSDCTQTRVPRKAPGRLEQQAASCWKAWPGAVPFGGPQ